MKQLITLLSILLSLVLLIPISFAVDDVYYFGSDTNQLNLNEYLGNVDYILTSDDVSILASTRIRNAEGATDVDQYLRFSENSGPKIVYSKDTEEKKVADYLYVDDNDYIFSYEMHFPEGFETASYGSLRGSSKITRTSATNDTDVFLQDLEDEDLFILGKTFSITKAIIQKGSSTDTVELTLMDGAIYDTLNEGETKTYVIDGRTYEVTVVIIADSINADLEGARVKLMINGQVTKQLIEGDTDTLDDGTVIGINDLLTNEGSEINGKDMVSFYIGANKIILKDQDIATTFSDSNFVEMDGESIEDAQVAISATWIDDNVKISTIKYRLKSDAAYAGDLYLANSVGLRESLDEPQGMLSDGWDIKYNGLKSFNFTTVSLEPNGYDGYALSFQNMEEKTYTLTMLLLNNGSLKLGDETDDFIFKEATDIGNIRDSGVIDQKDYFVVSNIAKKDSAITRILSFDAVNGPDGILEFSDIEDGSVYQVIFTPCNQSQRYITSNSTITPLVISGDSYIVKVNATDCHDDSTYTVAIDLNGDGVINGGFTNITLLAGSILSLGSITSNNVLPLEIKTLKKNFDNDIDDEIIYFNISKHIDNQSQVYISNITSSDVYFVMDSNKGDYYNKKAMTSYGIKVLNTIQVNDTEPNTVTFQIPFTQVQGNVSIISVPDDSPIKFCSLTNLGDYPCQFIQNNTFDGVFVVGSNARTEDILAAVDIATSLYNSQTPHILVGRAFLDSEINNVYDQNMIVVGNACSNSITAQLLGISHNFPACVEDFPVPPSYGIIKLLYNGASNALVVAMNYDESNFNRARDASTILANYESYHDQLEGKSEVIVSGTQIVDVITNITCSTIMDCEQQFNDSILSYCDGLTFRNVYPIIRYNCANPGTSASYCTNIPLSVDLRMEEIFCEDSCSNSLGCEYILRECNDGIDNDGEGLVDYPEDLGCESIYDDSESYYDYDVLIPVIKKLFTTNADLQKINEGANITVVVETYDRSRHVISVRKTDAVVNVSLNYIYSLNASIEDFVFYIDEASLLGMNTTNDISPLFSLIPRSDFKLWQSTFVLEGGVFNCTSETRFRDIYGEFVNTSIPSLITQINGMKTCLGEAAITCTSDIDCGSIRFQESCIGENNNTYNRQMLTPQCANPGTSESFCETNITVLSNLVCPTQCSLDYELGCVPSQCSDGIDNDLDGKIDFPNDTGCTDLNDNNETIVVINCSTNVQCGSVSTLQSCNGLNYVTTVTTPTCTNSGTEQSYCQNVTNIISTLVCTSSCLSTGCNDVISNNDISLGSSTTPASNLDEEYETYVVGILYQYANATCTFTLTNPKFSNAPTTQMINNINASIIKGTSSAIKMRVPEGLDAINRVTLSLNREEMGTYLCINGTSVVRSGSVYMQRENEFELKKVTFNYGNGLTSTINSESGDGVLGVKPRDFLNISVVGVNNFDSDFNVDLDMLVNFVDFDNDILFNDFDNLQISSDDESSVTSTATIDRESDAKTYRGYLVVSGTDDFGASHGEKWSFDIQVIREDYDINIESIQLSPTTLSCGGNNTAHASVQISNDGERKDRNVKIELVSNALNLFSFIDHIEMDSTDQLMKDFVFTIPSMVRPGSYNITVSTYSLGESLSHQKNVTLTVPDCSAFVACNSPLDCGSSFISNSCGSTNNLIFIQDFYAPVCHNPGSVSSYCEFVPSSNSPNITRCSNICSQILGCDYTSCSNKLDDDGDGKIDYPQDSGCVDYYDNDEFNSLIPCLNNLQCGQSTTLTSCNNLNFVTTVTTPTCINAGTAQSYCQNTINITNIQTCTLSCTNSGCINLNTTVNATTVVFANKLSINKVTADVDGSTTRLKNNDKLEDLKPGDSFNLDVEIENLFSSSTDMDIDVDVKIDCDSEIELDDTSDSTSISADDKDVVTFSGNVADDADDKTYECIITATGVDDNRTTYIASLNFKADVTREKYQLTLSSFTLSSSSLSCGEEVAQGTFKVTNTGSKKDKDAKVIVAIPSLKLYQTVDSLIMESDKSIKRNFEFNLPTKVKAGSYQVIATAYSQGVEITDSKTLTLVVPDCSSDEEELVVQNRTVMPIIPQPLVQSPVIIQPLNQNTNPQGNPSRVRIFAGFYTQGTQTCWLTWCWD